MKEMLKDVEKLKNSIENYDDKLYEIKETLEKADQLAEAFEGKYSLLDKKEDDYKLISRPEMLIDVRILQDYIHQALLIAKEINSGAAV